MRTLVAGIPLPHITFDNHSFFSAPSLQEYPRIIVEMQAVSRAVDDVVEGNAEHRNFAGQPVANAATTATAFGLSQLLAMRRREAEWFLARGGVLVCFIYPDVGHTGITGIDHWRRYSWLPAPSEFRYADHLLPGFGTSGAVLINEGHPFAPYVTDFGSHLAYRAVIDETAPNFSDYGSVFIRSAGGAAIGAELQANEGRIILLPPLARWDADRAALAQVLFDSLERMRDRP